MPLHIKFEVGAQISLMNVTLTSGTKLNERETWPFFISIHKNEELQMSPITFRTTIFATPKRVNIPKFILLIH